MKRTTLGLGLTIPQRGMSNGAAGGVTWNPDDKGAYILLSNGDLSVDTSTAGNWHGVRATVGFTSGKWQWEITTRSTFQLFLGVATASADLGSGSTSFIGHDQYGYGVYGADGKMYNNNVGAAWGTFYLAGSVLTFLLDMTAHTLEVLKNGVSMGTQDISSLSGAVFPAGSLYANGFDANFGPTLAYPQSGYDTPT